MFSSKYRCFKGITSARRLARPCINHLFSHLSGRVCISLLAIASLHAHSASTTTQTTAGKPPLVVATIAPLHSLVSGLLTGTKPAHLLLASAASAHSYSMKPSDARQLSKANIIVQIGPGLEGFLQKTLATVASSADVISAASSEGTTLLPARQFSGRGDEKPAHPEAAYDVHLWLSPLNNLGWINELTVQLKRHDPANTTHYENNHQVLVDRLTTLDADMATTLSSVSGQKFIAQHDAYQYLEKRYDLSAIGVMLDSHEQRMGVASLRALHKRAKEQQARCIVTAPGSTTSVLESVSALAKIPRVELDILGTRQAPGPELYFTLMRNIAGQLADCLGSA